MYKCASCKFIEFDVVRGDRCSITNRSCESGKYCKSYEMLSETEKDSIETNNFRMLKVIEDSKKRR